MSFVWTTLSAIVCMAFLGGTSLGAERTSDITPEFVANIARGFGSSVLQKTKSGQPIVYGRIGGQNYLIFLIDCEKGPSCSLIQFSAQLSGDRVDPDRINRWNREKRFGRVSLTEDKKVWVSVAVVTREGLPLKSLERYFGFWQLILKDLPPFITRQ